MSIEIVPTGAALGAEVRGVDLARRIDDETFAAIERAYNDHGVIFFRDQHITPPQQVAFTHRFGEIEFNIFGERWSVPGSPEIVVVSNVTEDGSPIGVRRAGENWHSDMRCRGACGGTSTGAVRCLTSPGASGPFHPLRRKSIAIRRSPIRSSGPIPTPGANASMSCATIAPGSRE